ncbi:MAG TPA: alpha/beta hydrolase-fold protein [Draconibacterium sp.]|nr:alpha/beta hydrolase-fold protein [Draconibacterium sp.]
MKRLTKKQTIFLLFAVSLFVATTSKALAQFNVKAGISVSPEIAKEFQNQGRLLLHITQQNEREPRNRSEITIGVTAQNWDSSKPFMIDTRNKEVLAVGLEKLSEITSGKFYFQVVYKQNKDDGNENVPGNLYSGIDSLVNTSNLSFNLTLNKVIPPLEIAQNKFVKTVVIQSKLLSDFSGYPRFLRASVLLPTGYFDTKNKNYPICYRVPGLNGRYDAVNRLLLDKKFLEYRSTSGSPQVIYVFLDSQGPYGDTYQMDSENNGPCGKALTEELIPEIEKQVGYRAETKMRFLAGCSTGGWVALGLQVFYPDFFDGTWSYSPDPVDFEHYGLINIYSDSSVFYNQFGYLQPGKRTIYGEPTYSMQEWIANENVAGRTNDYRVSGGQFGAYNAVFGPKGDDGLPSLMFDPVTGKIDHEIAKQWEKYDLKKVLEKNWSELGPKLQGKIWIWTGDMDRLYSNVARRFLQTFFENTKNPKSDAKVNFTPMANHCQEWSDEAVLEMIVKKIDERKILK